MEHIAFIIWALVLSAFFSGMELAFISSNKLRFELDKKRKSLSASIVQIFLKHPEQFISTMLVGNYLALVVYGLLVANLMVPLFAFINNQFLIILLQIVVAATIALFTTEFLPKTFFKYHPNFWMNLFSWPLLFFYVVFFPIAKFSSLLSVTMLRLTGAPIDSTFENNVFKLIDLNYLLQKDMEQSGNKQTETNEVNIFKKALDFSKIKLRDCYVPRTEIVALEYNTSLEILKQTFIETGLSKVLIYNTSIDDVVGYIHSTEMFQLSTDWHKHIHLLPMVPENMAAQRLMKIFLAQKKSIAVVVDEFGGTSGIITLEDIIEEIFGEIEDEHDTKAHFFETINPNEFVVSGRMELRQINDKLQLNLPEHDDYDTIAGFLLHYNQNFPKINETMKVGDYSFKCIKVSNNRIEQVKIMRL